VKVGVAELTAASHPANIVVQSGAWYGPWLTVGAILISATIAALIALHSLEEQRKIARKRATLDMLARKEWDRDYIEARAEFVKLRDVPDGLEMWSRREHQDSPQAINIRNTLNDYELIAVGIKEGILDQELYKRWFKTSFVKDWRAAREYVREIRAQAGTSAIFCEMDWLVTQRGESLQLDLPLNKAEPG
jgi:hypothetical protein